MAGATRGTLHPSLHRHGVRLLGVLAAVIPHRARRTAMHRPSPGTDRHRLQLARRQSRLDVHTVLRIARHRRRGLGRLARARRPPQGRCCRGVVLVRRAAARRTRRLYPPTLADVARRRRDWRHRAWPRLHLAGIDPREMVSRPSRHGDWHGDHGLRRRRDDRCASRRSSHELLSIRNFDRCLANTGHDGRHLFLLHDDRRFPLSHSAGGLAPGWLDTATGLERHDLAAQCSPQGRAQDAAVLADLVGALL